MAALADFDATTHDVAAVAARADTDVEAGLGEAEAGRRLERDGANALAAADAITWWSRLLEQFRDPLVYLLLAAVAVALGAWIYEGRHGTPYDAIVIGAVVIANAALGFVQERRAESAVAELQRMAAARATVLRDGAPRVVPATEVVVGDVLLLAEGDAVPADARFVAGTLSAAEAALTGESVPVSKQGAALDAPAALGDRTNMVFAGTAVTRGAGRAIVVATAMDTETGKIAGLLEETERDPTPLEREVAALGRTLGWAVVCIAAIVVTSVLLTAGVSTASDLVTVMLLGVALAVAAVPEGLPAIMSVVLALGVQRMAKRNAIVKDLASVETLGSATVICSDKTGTLTQNRMTVERVATHGAVCAIGELPPRDDPAWLEAVAVLGGGSLASDARIVTTEGGETAEGDPTEAAIAWAEHATGVDADRHERYDRLDAIPFTSERKLMSVLARDARTGGLTLVTKGAPDVLLARCDRALDGDRVVSMTAAERAAIEGQLAELSDDAMRVIGVAYRDLDADHEAAAHEHDEQDLVWAGMVGMIDPPREEARAAVAEAQSAGIRVVMITGDHPLTAARIASGIGIAAEGAVATTGAELEAMDERALVAAATGTAVFARVSPEHKLRLVDALQAEGEVVAMTGDGVNDAPALKSADIGVAMGEGGTAVAREAAAMILADDNFATIVHAVREGRGILDNITRFLRYLMASNLGEVLAIFVGVLLAGALGLTGHGEAVAAPLLATQILWINLLTDMAPALAIGAEPYSDDLMKRRPRKPGARIVDAAMWRGIAFTGAVMAAVTLFALDLFLPGGLIEGGESLDVARTCAFTVLVIANLANAFSARSETGSLFHRLFTNAWLWAAIGFSLALQVAVVHWAPLNAAFSTAPLTLGQWGLCVAIAMALPLAQEVRKAVLRSRAQRRRSPTVRRLS